MSSRMLLVVLASAVLPGAGFANYLDITHTLQDSGTFGPATFQGDFTQPTGTGTFMPFWRAQQHGNDTTYEFFNTDARPLSGDLAPGNNANGGNITNRTFLVSTLQAVNGDYVFILDSNQQNNAAGALISMDRFVIRTSPSQTLSTFASLSSAHLIYDIDTATNVCVASAANGSQAKCVSNASNGVILTEALNPGSGKSNMVALVPTSLFSGHTNEFLYLDVQFGQLPCCQANAGFEEWSALAATPEPAPYVFLTLATGAMVIWNTKRRRAHPKV